MSEFKLSAMSEAIKDRLGFISKREKIKNSLLVMVKKEENMSTIEPMSKSKIN